MNAVIVEIRTTQAAALTDDGRIIKVKNNDYAIGQVIALKKTMTKKARLAAMAASAAAVVVVAGVTAWAYFTPYSYVSLDVNPSIEYAVNRFDRVLEAHAVNGDGKEILKNLTLKNEPIQQAVAETVKQIEAAGYFNGDQPGGIMIAASGGSQQKSDGLAQALEDTAKKATSDTKAPVEVESEGVGYERVQEARTLGTTPGKLNLVQKLQASEGNASIDVQEWLKKPVKDIMKAIKEARKDGKTDSEGSGAAVSSKSQSEAASKAGASSSAKSKVQEQPDKNESKAAAFSSAKNKTQEQSESTSNAQKAKASNEKKQNEPNGSGKTDSTANSGASGNKGEAGKGNGNSAQND